VTDFRKYARGQDCQIRLPFICNHDPATTVLAHIRMAGITGMALKADDLLGAHSCSACHSAVDGATKTDLSPEYLRLCHLEGIIRTIALLIRQGQSDHRNKEGG